MGRNKENEEVICGVEVLYPKKYPSPNELLELLNLHIYVISKVEEARKDAMEGLVKRIMSCKC